MTNLLICRFPHRVKYLNLPSFERAALSLDDRQIKPNGERCECRQCSIFDEDAMSEVTRCGGCQWRHCQQHDYWNQQQSGDSRKVQPLAKLHSFGKTN